MTRAQGRVFDYIVRYLGENGWPPTIQEIADALGYSSRSTVHAHIHNLIQEGYLEGGVGRRLRPTRGGQSKRASYPGAALKG